VSADEGELDERGLRLFYSFLVFSSIGDLFIFIASYGHVFSPWASARRGERPGQWAGSTEKLSAG